MASASVSHLILFIASMVVAANVVGALTTEVNTVKNAIEEQSFDVADKLRTDVSIINDPGSAVWNREGAGNVTIYVKNTGSETLPHEVTDVDVIFDGQYESGIHITVLDGSSWTPDAVIEITFDHADPGVGEHRIKVVVSGGEDTFVYRQG